MADQSWVSRARSRREEAGFGFVLLVIALTYTVSVLADSPRAAAAVLVMQMVALHLVLFVVGARRALLLAVDVAVLVTLVVLIAVFVTSDQVTESSTIVVVIFWVSAALYGVAPLSIVARTLMRPTVDLQTLLGAIAAYLMIGMFFAFTYRALAASQSGPFYGTAGDGTVSDDLFFSFITLTTTGYGNIVPAANPGQTLAVVEAIVGQLFLVTAVAKIVNESGLLSNRRRQVADKDPTEP